MSKIHTTLHKKGDSSVDVYPNIESENIPSNAITSDKIIYNAITTAKILNGAVTSDKLDSNAVTTGKIASNSITSGKLASNSVTSSKIDSGAVTESKISNNAVTSDKIIDNAVTTSKINDGAVTESKLSNDIKNILSNLNKKYNFYFMNEDNDLDVYVGTFTASDTFESYSSTQIAHAFDFNRNQADYTEDDLIILSEFINGIDLPDNNYDSLDITIGSKSINFIRYAEPYSINYLESGTSQFKLEINTNTHTITSYTNTKYIKIVIKKFI